MKEILNQNSTGVKEVVKNSKFSVVGLDYMLVPSYNWKAMAWGNLWVEPNGDIYNCYGFDYVVGNVFRDSPLLAFNSKKQREFRQKLFTEFSLFFAIKS